jgi:hypothetical protein
MFLESDMSNKNQICLLIGKHIPIGATNSLLPPGKKSEIFASTSTLSFETGRFSETLANQPSTTLLHHTRMKLSEYLF